MSRRIEQSMQTGDRQKPLSVLTALTLSGVLLLGGCGGASTPAPTTPTIPDAPTAPAPDPTSITLGSEANRDGWAAPGGYSVSDAGSGVIAATGDHVMGGQSRRQFFSFDISGIPAGATIQAADLRLYQANVSGTPYTTHGDVVVDHLDYGTLEGSDYDLTPMSAAVATLSTDSTLEYKLAAIVALVQADLDAGRPRTQVRIRWSIQDNDNDPSDDQARFVDAEDVLSTGNIPELQITYVAAP